MKKIVLASNNPGKIKELQSMLAEIDATILPQSQFEIPEVLENGATFIENAILKARHAALLSGLPAIADDSGLAVDSLQGAPGIHSARYAGTKASSEENNAKLLKELQDQPESERKARFHCVIVYLSHAFDPMPLIGQGSWEGRILFSPQGNQGFGYDPIFYVPTHHCSAAELPSEEKNRISHRGQALRQLVRLMLSSRGGR